MEPKEKQPAIDKLFESVLLASATEATCVDCGAQEMVVPLDGDQPLDSAFLANYVCDECETVEAPLLEQTPPQIP